jgi:hypothetical protein
MDATLLNTIFEWAMGVIFVAVVIASVARFGWEIIRDMWEDWRD